MPGRIDGAMDKTFAASLQDLNQEVRVKQRFPTGEGHPSSRLVEEGPLLFYHRHQLFKRTKAPRHLCRQGGAGLGTLATESANGLVGHDSARGQSTCLHRADPAALTTPDAFADRKKFLDFR